MALSVASAITCVTKPTWKHEAAAGTAAGVWPPRYQAPYTTALTHAPSHLTERATHAHPLHPAALASVPSGKVLVRVRVYSHILHARNLPKRGNASSNYNLAGPPPRTDRNSDCWYTKKMKVSFIHQTSPAPSKQ